MQRPPRGRVSHRGLIRESPEGVHGKNLRVGAFEAEEKGSGGERYLFLLFSSISVIPPLPISSAQDLLRSSVALLQLVRVRPEARDQLDAEFVYVLPSIFKRHFGFFCPAPKVASFMASDC